MNEYCYNERSIPISKILEKLEQLQKETYGCGNGKIKIQMFIKELKREYDIKE